MKTFGNLLATELKRSVLTPRFPAGVLGIALICLFLSIQYMNNVEGDVIYFFRLIHLDGPIIMTYLLCALPCAVSYCEDKEKGYLFFILKRVSVRCYVIVKCLSCVCSSMAVMVLGKLLYVFLLQIKYPLINVEGVSYSEFTNEFWGLTYFIKSGHLWTYFLIDSAVMGLVAGMLAVLAFFVSMYITDRLSTIMVPVFGYYFIINGISNGLHLSYLFRWEDIFNITNNILKNNWLSAGYAVLYALIFNALFVILAIRRLRRVLYE